jgi:hypothetical protein
MIHFDWSQITRQGLIEALKPLGPHIVGQRVTVQQVQGMLRKVIKSQAPISVVRTQATKFGRNWIAVGGEYRSDHDRWYKKCMKIVLVYHPQDHYININAYRWGKIYRNIADTIMHEIVHLRQYRARNFKHIPGYQSTAYLARKRREQEYLGHPDEIGAYAFNIACELHDQFRGNIRRAQSYLNRNLGFGKRRSNMYGYLRHFDNDHNHPVIRRLKRKITHYLPYAALGQPFKTTDHMSR